MKKLILLLLIPFCSQAQIINDWWDSTVFHHPDGSVRMEGNIQEAKGWQEKYTSRSIDQAIQLEAMKAGAVDVEAVLKLVDRSKLSIDDNGNVTGVSELVQNLLKEKTYLTGKPATTTIGDATAPGGADSQAPKKFKASQLKDTKFYRENEADILKAMKLGLIEDDIPG